MKHFWQMLGVVVFHVHRYLHSNHRIDWRAHVMPLRNDVIDYSSNYYVYYSKYHRPALTLHSDHGGHRKAHSLFLINHHLAT
jgi:hypothetical protein